MEHVYDVVTLGESMWRLSPPGHARLEMTASLDVQAAGAESNVAVGLARMGKRTAWWSRLPDNPMGRHLANALRVHGVDTSGVKWTEGRLGTYFLEFGSSPRASQVIYDRAGSAASQMEPDDFDWMVLRRTLWLHLTGITPALSASCRATVERAIEVARELSVPYSFDLNYRAKLWSVDEARPICEPLIQTAALVMMAARDATAFFGTADPAALWERWRGPTVIVTRGQDGAVAYDGTTALSSPGYQVEIVDRIGAGDAFDTGLLSALLEGKPLEEALRWGNALAALKLTVPGDLAVVTRAEVEQLLTSGAAGLVR